VEQNPCEKIMKAPIGEEALPKNRIFGGYFDQQKIEKMTKNQHSLISMINISFDRI
jgi:hypothetical protein